MELGCASKKALVMQNRRARRRRGRVDIRRVSRFCACVMIQLLAGANNAVSSSLRSLQASCCACSGMHSPAWNCGRGSASRLSPAAESDYSFFLSETDLHSTHLQALFRFEASVKSAFPDAHVGASGWSAIGPRLLYGWLGRSSIVNLQEIRALGLRLVCEPFEFDEIAATRLA